MIEIIYKDEKQEKTGDEGLFSIPKNIRQIGEPGKGFRIYMEDYVYTFLGKISRMVPGRVDEGALAVLTGEICWQEGTACLFIRGALLAACKEPAPDHMDFSEEVWGKIHAEEEKYFPDQEIVGWFFAWPQQPMEVSEYLTRIHLKYFSGEKVLFLMDPAEREESFFRYENSEMTPVHGYYIYYEKNQPMQEYMLDKKAEFPAETAENVDDGAVKAFRTIIKGKKKEEEPEEEPGRSSVFSYAAAACLVLAVAAVGTSVYRNYQELQELESQPASSGELTAVTDGTVLSPTPAADTAANILEEFAWEETTEAVQTDGEIVMEETTPTESSADANAAVSEGTAASIENSETTVSTENSEAAASVENSETTASAENSEATASVENSETTSPVEDSETAASAETSENTGTELSEDTSAADAVSTAETTQAYLEESDTRKAKRRESETASSDSSHEMYIIRDGDTLYQISIDHYGSTDAVSEICSLNNLSENETIYPGQVIVLP